MAHHAGVPPATFAKIREYALLFWANRGNHNELTSQKFVPDVHRRGAGRTRR